MCGLETSHLKPTGTLNHPVFSNLGCILIIARKQSAACPRATTELPFRGIVESNSDQQTSPWHASGDQTGDRNPVSLLSAKRGGGHRRAYCRARQRPGRTNRGGPRPRRAGSRGCRNDDGAPWTYRIRCATGGRRYYGPPVTPSPLGLPVFRLVSFVDMPSPLPRQRPWRRIARTPPRLRPSPNGGGLVPASADSGPAFTSHYGLRDLPSRL